MSRRRRTRSRFTSLFRLSPLNIALLMAIALGLLFHQAVQSHRMECLQEETIQLDAALEHAQQEFVQASARWHRASARHRVVARAIAELEMIEPDASPREMVALRHPTAAKAGQGLPAIFDGLARGLDRFGEIREAAAVEPKAATEDGGRP